MVKGRNYMTICLFLQHNLMMN